MLALQVALPIRTSSTQVVTDNPSIGFTIAMIGLILIKVRFVDFDDGGDG